MTHARICGLWLLATMLLFSTSHLAMSQQKRPEPNPEDAAAGAAACTACCGGAGVMIVVPIVVALVFLVLNIALLIWVARDAKNRNMDSSVMWMMLVMFTGPIGLIIYIFSGPQGNMKRCDDCGSSRLQASNKCPHCGNA